MAVDRPVSRRVVLATAASGAGVLLPRAHGGTVVAMSGRCEQRGVAWAGATVCQEQAEEGAVTQRTNKELWEPWVALWNGDLAVADEIVAPGFVAHFAPVGSSPGEVRGPDGLQAWIGGVLAAFSDHRFETVVGPLAEGDLMAGRWLFRATYQGGIPGAAPEAAGRRVEYAGMDLLRIEAGRIAEYWLCADVVQLLQQVGAIPS